MTLPLNKFKNAVKTLAKFYALFLAAPIILLYETGLLKQPYIERMRQP